MAPKQLSNAGSGGKTEPAPDPTRQKIGKQARRKPVIYYPEDDQQRQKKLRLSYSGKTEAGATPMKPVIYYPEDEEGQKKFCRYYEQIKESEGFHFDELPPVDVIYPGVLPVELHEFDDPHAANVRNCVSFVIKQHNDAHRRRSYLKLDRIMKANWALVNGVNYYITFRAFDTLNNSSVVKDYEAEIYWQRNGTLETTLFREKGQRNPIRGLPNRPRTYM